MVADDIEHQARFVRIEFKPLHDAPSHSRGLQRMPTTGNVAFAGVMEQCRQQEQRGVGKVSQDAREIAVAQVRHRGGLSDVLRGPQCVQGIDQDEGMLVDRVAVVGVANHESVDPVELRDEQFEDAQSMHRAQCTSGKGACQNGLQVQPERWTIFQVRGENRQCLLDTALRLTRQTCACSGHGSKDRQHYLRLECGVGTRGSHERTEEDAAVAYLEILWPGLRTASAEHCKQRAASGRFGRKRLLYQLRYTALDHPSVPEIESHPVSCIRL